MTNCKNMQQRIKNWVIKAFGESFFKDPHNRCFRLIEEAVELAQTKNVDVKKIHELVDFVYSKPIGETSQELAGCITTLCAAAEAFDVNLDEVFDKEMTKIETPEIMEKCRAKSKIKKEALNQEFEIKLKDPLDFISNPPKLK